MKIIKPKIRYEWYCSGCNELNIVYVNTIDELIVLKNNIDKLQCYSCDKQYLFKME